MADDNATFEGGPQVGSTDPVENASLGSSPIGVDFASWSEPFGSSDADDHQRGDSPPRPAGISGAHPGQSATGVGSAATFGYRPPGAEVGSAEDSSFNPPRHPQPSFSPRPMTPPAKPAAPPKRPKGKLFVGSIILTLIGVTTYAIWNSTLRYAAYGKVEGRVVHVAAPWDGIVQSLHVSEGATLRQGEPLLTLQNLELQQQLEEVGDQLKISQADIAAETAHYRLRAEQQGDENQKAIAEYYEMWGRQLEEQAQLTSLESRLDRLEALREQNAVSEEEWESTRIATDGQRAKVKKLEAAVEQMRARSEPPPDNDDEIIRELQPLLARLKNLQAKLPRLRAQINQGKIHSPVDGRVVKRNVFVGEYAEKAETLIEVLEEGSLEIVLYMSQRLASRVSAADSVPLTIEPNAKAVRCRVVRVGDRLEPVPETLRQYYRSGETLLPVYLQPQSDDQDDVILRLGTEVKMPHTWGKAAS